MTDNPELVRLLLRNGANPTSCFPSHLRGNPPDQAMKIFVLGNPSAGKTTVVEALGTERQGFTRFMSRLTKVTGVDSKTAGIIPHDIHSKALGRVTLFDFAGHKEYYAGHDALLHSAMTNSSIVALVVDMRGEENNIRETLQYWFQFISYHSSEGGAKSYLVIIGSHADEIPSNESKQKSKLVESVVSSYTFDSIIFTEMYFMDCRYAESSSMTKLRSMLSQICQTPRSSEEMAAAHHSFLVFLLARFRKDLAITFSDATAELRRNLNSNKHIYLECVKSCDPFEMCEKLNERGNILFMKNKKQVENSWIVLDKAVLLSLVNGVIFAPKGFKEHRESLYTSTGLVPLSKLWEVFPELNPDMITKFLCHLEFCCEITDDQLLFLLSSEGLSSMTEYEQYFFFPGLVCLDKPQDVITSKLHSRLHSKHNFNSGWVLQCSKLEQFFSERFLQVLLLRLAFTFALAPTDPLAVDHIAIQRNCNIWRNGIHWGNEYGGGAIVEIVNLRQVIIIVWSYIKMELVRLRSAIISMVIDTKEEFCPKVIVRESLILPEDTAVYPLDPSKLIGISITEVAATILKGNATVVNGNKQIFELDRLICFEPYAYMGRSILERIFNEDFTEDQTIITDELLVVVATKCSCKGFNEYCTIFKEEINEYIFHDICELLQIFQLWRDKMGMEGTLKNFKKKLDQFSIFAGRNPLKLIPGN